LELVPFSPDHLRPFLRLAPPWAPPDREYYSRDALNRSVPPEDDEATYMAAADEWVDDNEGQRLVDDAGETYYGLPSGRVPH
jgi:hypothetical protein